MLSTIKIDFAENGNETGFKPVIKVVLKDSDDVRDKLFKTFFQSLGGESSWLVIKFDRIVTSGLGSIFSEGKETVDEYITISPVEPDELEKTIEIIKNRISPTKEKEILFEVKNSNNETVFKIEDTK